jgi:hypothetical protein
MSISPILIPIHTLLNILAAKGLTVWVLDISNAFQNAIIFDPEDWIHLSLPPYYLEWFQSQWPDYLLPSLNAKDLVIPCLKSVQGTKDAGRRWYSLLSSHLVLPASPSTKQIISRTSF